MNDCFVPRLELAKRRQMEAPVVDTLLSLFNLAMCVGNLYLAIGHVYGVRGFARAGTAILLAAGFAAIVVGYRFAVFLITLHTA